MSPSPEATELQSQQKRRKTAKDAGVSRFHPWSDPKHGVVFLKKHMVLGEDGTHLESKVIASRLFEALSRFGSVSLPAYEQTPQPGTLAADAHAVQLDAMASGGTASESLPQYKRQAATFENFVEFMLDEGHGEKKRLRAVRAALEAPAEENTDFRVTEPTDIEAFMLFLTFVTAPYEKVYRADAKYGSVPVHGRGNGYSAAKNYVAAMGHIDEALTGKSNIRRSRRVKDFLAKLGKDGPPVNPACAFDIAEVLPRWCGAIYEPEFEGRWNPFNTDILRIEMHTMFMTELATCARRSLFTKYCPRDLAARYVGGGLEMCSTHGRRRSVVKWGARCGAQAPDLREAGRWVENSKDFEEYWRDGVGRRAEAIASGEPDPIYSVWVWEPIVAPT